MRINERIGAKIGESGAAHTYTDHLCEYRTTTPPPPGVGMESLLIGS